MGEGASRAMRLRIIGSNGGFSLPGRAASGYLVDHDDTVIWLDCGSGTFMSLPIDPWTIDAIVVSHRHVDHCGDLLAAFHAFGYSTRPRTGVPVYAPYGVLDAAVGFVDPDDDHPFWKVFEFSEVGDGDEVKVDSISLSFALADHSVPDVATRFEVDGRSLVYSGDTRRGDWERIVTGADVFLCEATYQGEPGTHDFPYHLTASEAGEIASDGDVGELILTHISSSVDPTVSVTEAQTAYQGKITVAQPGESHEVRR